MKSLLTTLLFILTIYNTLAQTNPKFGSITLADLKQKKYDIDTTAAAVILYDYAKTYFVYKENEGVSFYTEFHTRKRILSNQATSLGIVDLPYYVSDYKSSQDIYDIKGTTYWLENNQVFSSDLSSKDIYSTKISDNYLNKKLTFPNVKNDCIIEYSYTVVTPVRIQDKPSKWYFQGAYPVLYSEYQILSPYFLDYNTFSTGFHPFSEKIIENRNASVGHSDLDGMGVYQKFVMKNIPAFQEEPHLSSKENYISKLDFELVRTRYPHSPIQEFSTTWPALNSTLITSENFGKVILRKTNFLKDYIVELKNITDKKEQLKAVYNKITQSFKVEGNNWNVFVKNEQKKVLDSKIGTSNQINALFISILRELDFDANPVILSTRSNGNINKDYPKLDNFNYIIAKVNLPNETLLIDATNPAYSMGNLPYHTLNYLGFEVKQSGGELIEINPKTKFWNIASYTTEIDVKNQRIKGSVDKRNMGYSEYETREKYLSETKDFESNYIKNHNSYTITNLSFKNLDDNSLPIYINYNFENIDEELDDPEIIYFNPFLDEVVEKNPFQLKERNYPVDFGYPHDYTFSNKIKIPEGYYVETLPESKGFGLSDKSASFTYKTTLDEATGEVTVLSRYNIKRTLYHAEEYEGLKELFSQLVKKSNEQIIFKKK